MLPSVAPNTPAIALEKYLPVGLESVSISDQNSMKSTAIRLSALLLLTAVFVGQQLQEPELSIGGEVLRLNMDKAEVLKKLSGCCNSTSFGATAAIVMPKENASSEELGGEVYFERGKLSGIAADRDWNPEPASHRTALALYRLVDKMAHGKPARMTIYAYSRDMSNGEMKSVVMQFADGRRIKIEIQDRDSGPHQVIVSECVGACVDW